ncbi:hypothetical protein EV132_11367 [Rhizobium sullae]|uniref:Antifreeze protein n=1 Tax=Rhizobium sullae TaxID=50338 RepID=A0A4R3PYI4_RHISU|nr:hypothetical protein EV132_11367 [Rhizobium sullae]
MRVTQILMGLAAAATLMTAPATSFSQDFEFYIGRDQPRYYYDDDDYERPRYRYDRQRPRWRQCTPGQALNISRRYLRNPRVARASYDSIVIIGRGRVNERIRMVFGTEPGCPRIG